MILLTSDYGVVLFKAKYVAGCGDFIQSGENISWLLDTPSEKNHRKCSGGPGVAERMFDGGNGNYVYGLLRLRRARAKRMMMMMVVVVSPEKRRLARARGGAAPKISPRR